ncbi:hypothetical protein BDR26DRAFT_1005677 [Obelidium mucronatum]|nr:hypothetical protein BDR26DRAFT_1005677 [Obelidium mucronatum]
MENSSRKSQIRSLEEQVGLSFDEVAVVYDCLRVLEFANEETELALMAPLCPATASVHARVQEEKREEDALRALLINAGAWGLVSRKRRGQTLPGTADNSATAPSSSSTNESNPAAAKSIKLSDFRKVFARVSPWKSNPTILHSVQPLPPLRSSKPTTHPKTTAGNLTLPNLNIPRGLSASRSSTTGSSSMARMDSTVSIASGTSNLADVHISLADRVYFYSSFNYSSFHANRAAPQGGMGADYMKTSGGGGTAGERKNASDTELSYVVDLASIAELKAVMDSMLEMFEKAGKQTGGGGGSGGEDDEEYMRAVSSFLNSALKLGANKGVGGSTAASNDFGANGGTGSKRVAEQSKLVVALEEDDEGEGLGDIGSLKMPAPPAPLLRSVSSLEPRVTLPHPVVVRQSSAQALGSATHSRASSAAAAPTEFRLSFNEFLLAVLSQSKASAGSGGSKKKGKGKGKKIKVKLPSYFDRKGPIYLGPFRFNGKVGEEAQLEYDAQAVSIREKAKYKQLAFERENTHVCFRVRQIEIDPHDFYVTLPKESTLSRLQIEIAKRQHLGSVIPSDIAIYRPSDALEKNIMFGSSMTMLKSTTPSKEPQSKPKPAMTSSLAAPTNTGHNDHYNTDQDFDNGMMISMMDSSDSYTSSPPKKTTQPTSIVLDDEGLDDDATADPFEYFKETSLSLRECFPKVNSYAGGSYSFVYNPNGPSCVIVPPPEPVKPPPPEPPKPPKKESEEKGKKGSKKGKEEEAGGKKKKAKKKKKKAPKKVEKPKPPPPIVPLFIDAPTPINVYYDIIPYFTFQDDVDSEPSRPTLSNSKGLKDSTTPLQTDKKQPTPSINAKQISSAAEHSKISTSFSRLPPIPNRPHSSSSATSIDFRHPLLTNPTPKPSKVYTPSTPLSRRPHTAPSGRTISFMGGSNVFGTGRTPSFMGTDHFQPFTPQPPTSPQPPGSKRNIQSAPPGGSSGGGGNISYRKRMLQSARARNLATDGNRRIPVSRPSSSASATANPRLAETVSNTAATATAATATSISPASLVVTVSTQQAGSPSMVSSQPGTSISPSSSAAASSSAATTAAAAAAASALWRTKDPISIPWDKRWMNEWKCMGGDFEWSRMMKNCETGIEVDEWEEYLVDAVVVVVDDDDDVTIVDDDGDEDGQWRLKEWIPNEKSVQWRAEAKKRIDAVVVVEEPDKKKGKGKKGKKGGGGKKKKK